MWAELEQHLGTLEAYLDDEALSANPIDGQPTNDGQHPPDEGIADRRPGHAPTAISNHQHGLRDAFKTTKPTRDP